MAGLQGADRKFTASLHGVYTQFTPKIHSVNRRRALPATVEEYSAMILSDCAGLCASFWRNNCVKRHMQAKITKKPEIMGKMQISSGFSMLPHFEAVEIDFINPLNCPFWD
jgi:hypothetical protein